MAVKLIPGVNDLATTNPSLAKEWAADLNHNISPKDITSGSAKEVWWRCSKGHEWQTRPATRSRGVGCPFCVNQRAWPGFNDLLSLFPEIAREWDPKRNGDMSASKVVSGSNKKYWWICPSGHSFESAVSKRTISGQGCPFCSGNRVLAGFNDLKTTRPELASEWSDKNYPTLATEVTAGSNRKYWWICKKGHEWKQSPNVRSSGNNCPYCSHQTHLAGYNDLATINPKLAQAWDETKNGAPASSVMSNARIAAWWKCDAGHSWQANLRGVRDGQCPYCTNRQLLAGFNDLESRSPELARQWNSDRNRGLSPSDVLWTGRDASFWWDCDQGHTWKATLASRNMGSGCPVCSNQLIEPGVNDMASTHPELAASFHPSKNGGASPDKIFAGTGAKFWWQCELGHEWRTTANSRFNGTGCPYCSNVKFLAGFNDLESRSPEIARQWNYKRNGGLVPSQVKFTSRAAKYWWICDQLHEWEASLASRNNGNGCPDCAEYGFKPNKPAIFYFIENTALRARKIGITNIEDRAVRLSTFSIHGWKQVHIVESDDGAGIRELEGFIKKWIRKDLKLPQYLSPEEMRITGGWTETFSIDGPSNQEVKKMIKIGCKRLGLL